EAADGSVRTQIETKRRLATEINTLRERHDDIIAHLTRLAYRTARRSNPRSFNYLPLGPAQRLHLLRSWRSIGTLAGLAKTLLSFRRNMNIFISFASEQKDIAEEVSLRLKERNHLVFFSATTLPSGLSFDYRIQDAVNSAHLFIFLISPQSVAKGRYT